MHPASATPQTSDQAEEDEVYAFPSFVPIEFRRKTLFTPAVRSNDYTPGLLLNRPTAFSEASTPSPSTEWRAVHVTDPARTLPIDWSDFYSGLDPRESCTIFRKVPMQNELRRDPRDLSARAAAVHRKVAKDEGVTKTFGGKANAGQTAKDKIVTWTIVPETIFSVSRIGSAGNDPSDNATKAATSEPSADDKGDPSMESDEIVPFGNLTLTTSTDVPTEAEGLAPSGELADGTSPDVQMETGIPALPAKLSHKENSFNPTPLSMERILEIGKAWLDGALATAQFIPEISEAVRSIWPTVDVEAWLNLEMLPVMRPYISQHWEGIAMEEHSFQVHLMKHWIPFMNALLGLALRSRYGDDVAVHIFRENTIPDDLAAELLKKKDVYTAESTSGSFPLGGVSGGTGGSSAGKSTNKNRKPDFYAVVQRRGYRPRVMAALEVKPWITLGKIAYSLLERAPELVMSAPPPSDCEADAPSHAGNKRSWGTKAAWLVDQIASQVYLTGAPMSILLTTFQAVVLENQRDPKTGQYDFYVHRTCFSTPIPETFKDENSDKAESPGCSGSCGCAFVNESRVALIPVLVAVLLTAVERYLNEAESYTGDLGVDAARRHSNDNNDHMDAEGGTAQRDATDDAAAGQPDGSDVLVYRQLPQATGRDADVHLGCIVRDGETVLGSEVPLRFCCQKTSVLNKYHTPEATTAEGRCAAPGHTSCVVKFPRLFDEGIPEEDAERNERAVIAVKEDARIIDLLRKSSPSLAHLIPEPLGTFKSTKTSERLVRTYTDCGWSLNERNLFSALDLDESGRQDLFTAIRYAFGCLHRARWIHGDVGLRNICVRIFKRHNITSLTSASEETVHAWGKATPPSSPRSDSTSVGRFSSTSNATDSAGCTSSANTSASMGYASTDQFPPEARVANKSVILEVRLIDFSLAQHFENDKDLSIAVKDEVDALESVLNDLLGRLRRASERTRAA